MQATDGLVYNPIEWEKTVTQLISMANFAQANTTLNYTDIEVQQTIKQQNHPGLKAFEHWGTCSGSYIGTHVPHVMEQRLCLWQPSLR